MASDRSVRPASGPRTSNMTQDEWAVIAFETAEAFETWLDANHGDAPGLWIRFAKKGRGLPSVTMNEAVEVALCFGWIDSRLQPVDDDHYIMRFQPRRPRSNWSARNKARVERLGAEGRMRPAGHAEVRRAKADGRWDAN
jgi:uncharacterized protein YdeI (YjbR/CyaY-like superfamily)